MSKVEDCIHQKKKDLIQIENRLKVNFFFKNSDPSIPILLHVEEFFNNIDALTKSLKIFKSTKEVIFNSGFEYEFKEAKRFSELYINKRNEIDDLERKEKKKKRVKNLNEFLYGAIDNHDKNIKHLEKLMKKIDEILDQEEKEIFYLSD